MNTKTITVKQASQAINKMATDFMESNEINSELLSVFTAGISSDVTAHLRDYVLGMPIDFGTQFMINFAEAIEAQTPEGDSVAIKTILSSFYFENLETAKAKAKLDEALALNPTYSLAQLLSRVFNAGWPVESFATMRAELHPQVVKILLEEPDKEI